MQTDGALSGVRVIDLATVVMGPYAAQILGDLGADVIKVEAPGGDSARLAPPARHPGMGHLALNVNRNKRSVTLDLKSADGKAAFRDLVAGADILITNMRPGALDRLGISHAELAEINPRLITCRAQGFRSDSALADRAAYDEIVQAASGMTDIVRRATGTPSYVPTVLADKVCALTIAYSVLAALVHQRATGEGQEVEVPMADTMLAFTLVEHLAGHTFVPDDGGTGFNRSLAAGHAAVATQDGWACILPYSPRNIADFFAAAGRDDLATDERFVDRTQLARHQEELYGEIAAIAPTRTTDAWATLCAEHSIPFAPVLDLETAHEDPYVVDGGLLTKQQHPTEGTYRSIGFPVRFSATPAGMRTPTPRQGDDTAEVLRELGRSEEQIEAMVP
ncbi:CoA transferase [Actinomycetospora corticicola]|uniref:Crotonobetainyl-CoA:carnitine CoA-transferase CaiB-like acyl-CoA transferase n=1 Tax=Actinomycetospora corticicola TaxID=663602 RepID=A0A7Y9DW38_9PSEU|nr:CoA transferase [Actinomycetospora corticicola]NYD36582.1 crotonobetainyl-CoA:carnitine CoA-transferase CaiB-like acyl-CoA transferase [Actinomycetospora corticicola]